MVLMFAGALISVSACSYFGNQPRVSELAVIPDKRVALYVKFRPPKDPTGFRTFGSGGIWCVSWDPGGNLERRRLCDIWTDGKRRELPRFVAGAVNGPYCFTTFVRSHNVLTSLWEVDPTSLRCREVIRGSENSGVVCLEHYNILDGRFPAMFIDVDPSQSDPDKVVTVVVSIETGGIEHAPGHVHPDREGTFLLNNGRIVWAESDAHQENDPGILYEDDRAVADGVMEVLGITADTGRVLFSKLSLKHPEDGPHLWSYDVATGRKMKLLDWVGDQSKVGVATGNIGFLKTRQRARESGRSESPKLVVGAEVYNTDGELLQSVVLPKAVSHKLSDWDVDLMEMVHYDPESHKIVIQKLDGGVITSFTP